MSHTNENGDPSLDAAIAFFTEAEPSRFARLPYETLWKIFTMKQELEMCEMCEILKNVDLNCRTFKIGRLEISGYKRLCRFRLTGISYRSKDIKGLRELFKEYRDIMHLQRTTSGGI